MNIDDLFHKEDVEQSIKELLEALKDFDSISSVIIIWNKNDGIHNRLYGDYTELTGILERSKFSLLNGELDK
jgi:hypothetical protein